MDRMIDLVETLRFRRGYAGYLHAKAVSGAEPDQVERLALLCDRVSYNLEAVCQATLDSTMTGKSFAEGLAVLDRVRQIRTSAGSRRLAGDPRPAGPAVSAGATTQVVVGLGPETDREVLGVTAGLWRDGTIHHPQFAAFRPIENTPMEQAQETPVLRENRLYQADYLIRRYGFSPDELVFAESGNLPQRRDPKLEWALAHLGSFPVEITTANRRTLLRVPGLGPKTVDSILELRRRAAAVGLSDLRRIGTAPSRAAGFLAWRGKRLGDLAIQEPLFTPEDIPEKSRVYGFSPGTFR
jgi:predicted DNA-binding helix-hairpin-helix protein